MDSGFWSAKTIRACRRHQIRYSITVRQTTPIRQAIAAIDEDAWVDILYPEGGLAQVAETRYQGGRLVVRRTRLVGTQAELFPTWRYHAFVTDRVGTTVWLDQDHRRHATVELCIRDLKGPQPAALDRPDRAGRPRGAGGGQDPAPDSAGPARPTDPLRPPPAPASARRLAVGTMVRAGPGAAALCGLRHLTHAAAERTPPDPFGSA
jgi:hypothetical protein